MSSGNSTHRYRLSREENGCQKLEAHQDKEKVQKKSKSKSTTADSEKYKQMIGWIERNDPSNISVARTDGERLRKTVRGRSDPGLSKSLSQLSESRLSLKCDKPSTT